MTLEINFQPSYKQDIAWKLLEDKITKQLGYGGGGGGGKTYLGSAWKIYRRLMYPGTRGLIAREQLNDLLDSVKITFDKVLKLFGLKLGVHYKYNGTDHEYTFYNGSTEKLQPLPWEPSDPEYEYLGSKEYTDVWVEEASEVTEKAVEVVTTRIRWMLGEYGLLPKLLLTFNPSDGWLYKEFYLPDKEGTLEHYRKFVRALVQDNPDPEFVRIYLESLNQVKDPITRARIRDGDWEYNNDDNVLYYHEKLLSAFHNTFTPEGKGVLTVDTSRFGKDETVIWRYSGLRAKQRYVLKHSRDNVIKPTEQVITKVKELEKQFSIPRHNVVVDELGAGGGGVVDGLPGCINFVGNSSPVQVKKEPASDSINTFKPNFDIVKAQCAYFLADKLNDNEFAIEVEDRALQTKIIEEAKAHKKRIGKKLGITPKDDIKALLKRSPDDWDNFIMRMILEIKKPAVNPQAIMTFNKRINYDKELGII